MSLVVHVGKGKKQQVVTTENIRYKLCDNVGYYHTHVHVTGELSSK